MKKSKQRQVSNPGAACQISRQLALTGHNRNLSSLWYSEAPCGWHSFEAGRREPAALARARTSPHNPMLPDHRRYQRRWAMDMLERRCTNIVGQVGWF